MSSRSSPARHPFTTFILAATEIGRPRYEKSAGRIRCGLRWPYPAHTGQWGGAVHCGRRYGE